MMNMTHTPQQDIVNALFLAASKLNEDMYVGDVVLNDEGVAKTSVIKADGKVETLTLDKELQEKFQSLTISSASKAHAVSKLETAVVEDEVEAKDE